MKLKEAVLKSLKELNVPATYKNVYLHIVENNYYDFEDTVSPESSVSAALGNLSRNEVYGVKRTYLGKNLYEYSLIE